MTSEGAFPRFRARGGRYPLGGSYDFSLAFKVETYSGLTLALEGECFVWHFRLSARVFFSARQEERSMQRTAVELLTTPKLKGVSVAMTAAPAPPNPPEPQGGQSWPG